MGAKRDWCVKLQLLVVFPVKNGIYHGRQRATERGEHQVDAQFKACLQSRLLSIGK